MISPEIMAILMFLVTLGFLLLGFPVALTLAEHGARIGVSNRSRTSSEELVHLIGGSSSVVEQEAISDADLVINATPLGMNDNEPMPIDVNLLGTGQCVVDLIYKPEKTKLLKFLV